MAFMHIKFMGAAFIPSLKIDRQKRLLPRVARFFVFGVLISASW
jgi:hypothetical protein